MQSYTVQSKPHSDLVGKCYFVWLKSKVMPFLRETHGNM